MSTVPLNKLQSEAYSRILTFDATKGFNQPKFFVLSGWAGTGKTYLTGALNNALGRYGSAFTAPTNKATKVVASTVGKGAVCKTIYSLLGIKMAADEDVLKLEFPKIPVDLSAYDRIFVDEASMISKDMLSYIKERSYHYKTKWILTGDRGQLSPVGEEISEVWKMDCESVHLDEVMRYDNEILAFATHLRKQIQRYPKVNLKVSSNHGSTEGVWKYPRGLFMKNIGVAAKKGLFTNVNDTKIVAWRNKTVSELNEFVRYHIFGPQADKTPYLPGDRIMIGEPVDINGSTIAHIDDEGTVLECSVAYHSTYRNLSAYFVTVAIDDSVTLVLHVLHPNSERHYTKMLNDLALKAKDDKMFWKEFWGLRKAFHKVRYSYALTGHRVQGSTLTNVFLDTTDILANSNSLEALRCFYVGATRPTTKLILT